MSQVLVYRLSSACSQISTIVQQSQIILDTLVSLCTATVLLGASGPRQGGGDCLEFVAVRPCSSPSGTVVCCQQGRRALHDPNSSHFIVGSDKPAAIACCCLAFGHGLGKGASSQDHDASRAKGTVLARPASRGHLGQSAVVVLYIAQICFCRLLAIGVALLALLGWASHSHSELMERPLTPPDLISPTNIINMNWHD